MTEDQVNRITALAVDAERKRVKFDLLAARNTANLSREEREQLAAAYHLAEAEYLEAMALLGSAKQSVCGAQKAAQRKWFEQGCPMPSTMGGAAAER